MPSATQAPDSLSTTITVLAEWAATQAPQEPEQTTGYMLGTAERKLAAIGLSLISANRNEEEIGKRLAEPERLVTLLSACINIAKASSKNRPEHIADALNTICQWAHTLTLKDNSAKRLKRLESAMESPSASSAAPLAFAAAQLGNTTNHLGTIYTGPLTLAATTFEEAAEREARRDNDKERGL